MGLRQATYTSLLLWLSETPMPRILQLLNPFQCAKEPHFGKRNLKNGRRSIEHAKPDFSAHLPVVSRQAF